MTETAVPDDLMNVAEETFDLMLCECAESCGGTDGLRRESIATLARALAAERERATLAERERIAKALDDEADVIPCAEDAMVTRGNALLVRADFSYEEADRIEESIARP